MKHTYAGNYDASRQYKRGDVVRMKNGQYHVFSHRGFIDTVAPLDLSCVGPAGADGIAGIAGIAGRDSTVPGPPGRDGADSTVPGPRGPRGRKGEEGATFYSSTVRKVSENAKMQIGFSGSMARGDAVRIAGDNVAAKALAHGSDAAAMAVGLVSSAGEVQTSGPFVNEAWSLTPGSVYYLSASVPGGITDIQPLSIGDYIIIIGFAVAPQTLVISIHHAIKLGT